MFDIGWTELLLIGIVALIVVGPKELPGMFRKMGQLTGKARAMARDFQRAMESAADEAGVKDIQRDFRNMTSDKSLGLKDVETSIKSGLSASDFTADWNGKPLKKDAPGKPAASKSDAAAAAGPAMPAEKPGAKATKATGTDLGTAPKRSTNKAGPKTAAAKTAAAKTTVAKKNAPSTSKARGAKAKQAEQPASGPKRKPRGDRA